MKNFQLSLSLLILAGLSPSAFAQFSTNVVGYYNRPISAGDNLIANQLYARTNTLNGLFLGGTPNGSTCTKWDAANQQFLPTSLYTSGSGWSINYDLQAGEGALFHTISSFTNTFVGEVHFLDGENVVFTYPSLAPGIFLLSCSVPAQATFNQVIGRNRYETESVRRLDSTLQSYYTTTFHNGAWDNGIPALQIGESAFFTVVPEPGVSALLACGVLILSIGRFAFARKYVKENAVPHPISSFLE